MLKVYILNNFILLFYMLIPNPYIKNIDSYLEKNPSGCFPIIKKCPEKINEKKNVSDIKTRGFTVTDILQMK